jgi:hypothetical protein
LKEKFENLGKSPYALSAEPSSADLPGKPVHSPFYTKYQDRLDIRRSKLVNEEQENRRSLLKEIHATRHLRDSEMKFSRLLEYKILKGWNSLKKIRKQNEFASTRLNLVIKVKEMDEDTVSTIAMPNL